MHPITQRLPVHAVLLCGLGARTAFQNQCQCQQAPDLRTVLALASETTKLRSRMLRPCDRQRRRHPMPPICESQPRPSNQNPSLLGIPHESQPMRIGIRL